MAENTHMQQNIDLLRFSTEFRRKVIHLGCSILPLLYYFYLSREQIILLSGMMCIGFLSAEFLRFRFPRVQALFSSIFQTLLRESEKTKNLTGATYLFLSATVTFVLFEKNIAVPSVLVLTVADSLAAVAGKMINSIRFFSKTLAGSLAFFITGLLVLWLFVPAPLSLLLLVIGPLTILEAAVVKINDNLLIPLSTGFILYLVSG
jgi:dolichol kinase